jgi:hypothetical protein
MKNNLKRKAIEKQIEFGKKVNFIEGNLNLVFSLIFHYFTAFKIFTYLNYLNFYKYFYLSFIIFLSPFDIDISM